MYSCKSKFKMRQQAKKSMIEVSEKFEYKLKNAKGISIIATKRRAKGNNTEMYYRKSAKLKFESLQKPLKLLNTWQDLLVRVRLHLINKWKKKKRMSLFILKIYFKVHYEKSVPVYLDI